MSKVQFKDSPFKVIVSLYLLFSFIFMVLYLMPLSHTKPLSIVDAWFLATSGMSVTGLSTINVSEHLTVIGKSFLFIQIQFGGIGIMAILGSLLIFFKGNVSLPQQTLMSFDQNQKNLKSVKKLMIFIFSLTIILELIGFFIFFPTIHNEYGDLSTSIFISAFHSASSFTNAGFDLFGDSLISFSANTVFVLTTSVLLFFGIIGFPVILEVLFSKGKKKSLYTKVNLVVHGILLLFAFIAFYLFEFTNSFGEFSLKDKITNAFFLSVTSRNGGLTTIDIGNTMPSTLMLLMLLMFIGASASSCGGGVRTTTFAVLFAKVISIIKGREDVVMFKKTLHAEDVNKSFLVVFVFFFTFFISTIVLTTIEGMPLHDMSFEVMSALTTTGLSTGITSELSSFSKIWLSILMIIGRIGIIALIYSIIKPKKSSAKYPKENLIVG